MTEQAIGHQSTVAARGPGMLARLALVLKLVMRDWRAGELRLLMAAVLVAVGTVTTISLFVDRLHGAMLAESSTLLAADRVITGSSPIPDHFIELAEAQGLRHVQAMTFQTMVYGDDRNQLVSVRAVGEGYPLRGEVRIADEPFGSGYATETLPAPGELWVDSRLFPGLGIDIGDEAGVGLADLTVSGVLVSEPDRSGRLFDLGPRMLMRIEDVPATQVVQPGSRIGYRLLLAGPTSALDAMRAELGTELEGSFNWRDVRDSTPTIGTALDRAENFLMLGGLLAVLLAGVAVALSAQRYAVRHYDYVAILKTLGLTPKEIQRGYVLVLLVVGTLGTAAGLALGFGLHSLIVALLRDFLPPELPLPGVRPLLVGAASGFVCLLAFGLPPILQLRSVSPMRVIRRELAPQPVTRALTYGAAALGSLGLLVWYTSSWWLTFWTLSGVAVMLLLFGGLSWLLLSGSRIAGMQAGSYWRLGMAALQRRRGANIAQILIFGLAIMLLLILVLTRTALLDDWRAQLPDDAPNHFVMNITPGELNALQDRLDAETDYSGELFPMLRGRVTHINETPVREWDQRRRPQDDLAGGGPALGAERSISWSDQLPTGNRLAAGRWWDSNRDPAEDGYEISVEQGYARANGVAVGDWLRFDIGGIGLEAEVTSLRELDWDSMQPNFFILFSPEALRDFPATYMTSFHLPDENRRFLNDLLADFPTITVIEIDEILNQVRDIIGQVSRAVELVLILVLASGCLVLVASIQASRDERLREHALVRTLGGSRALILRALAVEFAALGLFAGVLATLGAELTVYLLQTQIFQIPFQPHYWLWVAGPVLGTVLILTVGLLGTRRLVRSPPMTVLRELD